MSFLFLNFVTAFQLLPYSYYNPYNMSALINAHDCFSENNVFFFFVVVFCCFFLIAGIASLDDVALCHDVSS